MCWLQVAMESNGKGVDINGVPLPYKAGEVDFGEPGTNGQHSFYQLIHQGRPVPAEFIGVIRSQQSVYLKGEIVSNHDELMCNFFAQADALAIGKAPVELRSENVPDMLIPHKTFTGNRPSMSIMLPELNAYTVGQLLALYEDRIAVQVRPPPAASFPTQTHFPICPCVQSKVGLVYRRASAAQDVRQLRAFTALALREQSFVAATWMHAGRGTARGGAPAADARRLACR